MSELSDKFLVLGASPLRPGPSQLTTNAAPGVPGGALLGIGEDHSRHFLLPIGTRRLTPDLRSRHLALVEQHLTMTDGQLQRFADVRCDDPDLFGVYGYVLDDLASRLSAGGGDSIQICRDVLSDWRALITAGTQGLGREAELGLFGELLVLARLRGRDPAGALSSWKGPEGSSWDFVGDGQAIEVKTTSAVSGSTVRVSNIEQLDPVGLAELDLVVVQVRSDDVGSSVDEEIDELVGLGFDSRDLLAGVARVGHRYGQGVGTRFSLVSLRKWRVDDTFPSLRRADIPVSKSHALQEIKYQLALPEGAVDLTAAEGSEWLREWPRS